MNQNTDTQNCIDVGFRLKYELITQKNIFYSCIGFTNLLTNSTLIMSRHHN